MERIVANDAPFADVGAANFELRLDEDYHFSARGEQGGEAIEQECDADETDIADEEAGWLADGGWLDEAGVLMFVENDARVCFETPGDLGCADVDTMNFGRAVLQEAVCEATGGGADIDADQAGRIDCEVVQGFFEFEAATADVAELLEDFDGRFGWDLGTGFVDLLTVYEDLSGEDEGLGFFARLNQISFDEELVEAGFQDLRSTMRSATSMRRRARAPKGARAAWAFWRSSSAIRLDSARP